MTKGDQKAVSYIPDERFGITLPKDIPLPSGTGIGCSTVSSDYVSRTPVMFGENTKSGCTMWLKRSDLAASNCNALRKQIFDLQTLTASKVSLVGIFGNASISKEISDWVKVINSPPDTITGLAVGV